MFKIDKRIINILKGGGVGVLPTDTLYGLVGSALNKETVERIYEIKKREKEKKMIILISKRKDLDLFGIEFSDKVKKFLKKVWPKPVSVVLPLSYTNNLYNSINYLHRGSDTLAFRVPKLRWLRKLLKETGPLVAPSANPESLPPAQSIEEAKGYFGDKVDFYVDGGQLSGEPSTIVRPDERGFEIRRQGAVKI
ncbi:MAG: L-threonylcarbamoyladenylate synthase [Patescibacteria group bacterium]